MPFEDFDNKLKQAADQHHPSYDENAWAKMEKLLDQHLPVKKERKNRFILFFLLFLLIGGGAWLFISTPWQQSSNATSGLNQTEAKTKTPAPNDTNPITSSDQTTPATNSEKEPGRDNLGDHKNDIATVDAGKANNINGRLADKTVIADANVNQVPEKATKSSNPKNEPANQLDIAVTNAGKGKRDTQGANGVDKTSNTIPPAVNTSIPALKNDVAQTDKTPAAPQPGQSTDKKTEESKEELAKPDANDKKEVAKKIGQKKSNYLSFSVSAAPDISSVSFNGSGKFQLLAGAGVGYTFNNKWTIRTGFYTARKVYSANKEQYKPEGGLPNYRYLENIDADCDVYEIPVNISYNFSKSDRQSFFVTTGLSTLIMKKEVYQYFYKYPGNPPPTYTYTKSIKNENKHYFSVLTLSAGYGRRLNNTFAISAEPYIKLPLTGIGYGNVKLNSAGILFSVNVTPFRH
ncbi:MAG TPA: hypothetical protein VFI06_13355 [Chitinophagaceae bacterium]|nr:hypothetical protein [Chitinophagaceae bacterium]